MTLGSLLDRIRATYVQHFEATIRNELASGGVRVIAEPALRRANGEIAFEGAWQLPLRKDLAVLKAGRLVKFVQVEADRTVAFDPVRFSWDDRLEVELDALRWERVFVELSGNRAPDLGALTTWFWRWFKKDLDGEGELLGVVHFLSDPEVSGGTAFFELDLGSVPVRAFEELLDALVATGATRCRFLRGTKS